MSTIESRAGLVAFTSAQRMSGVPVIYSRGVTTGTIALAVPGDTLVEVVDEEGFSVKLKVRDYIVRRSDLEAILGAGEEPQRGDTIEETVADYDRTFDVFEVGGEVFRWWDKTGQVFRIHSVEVSKVTTTTTGA
jgi:hypothetical protein